MSEDLLLAIPSINPGGLEAELSAHFGHCDIFTLVQLKDGKIADVSILPNLPHEQGGCLAPVNHLSGRGVNILIAGGMGMRPLLGFESVGIDVYHNSGLSRVADVVSAFAEGRLPKFSSKNTCGGGDHGHGGGCHGH